MRARFLWIEWTLGRLLSVAAVVLAVSMVQAAPPKKTDKKPPLPGPVSAEPSNNFQGQPTKTEKKTPLRGPAGAEPTNNFQGQPTKTQKRTPLRGPVGAEPAQNLQGQSKNGLPSNANARAAGAKVPDGLSANLKAGQVEIASISPGSGKVTAVDPVKGRNIEFQVSDPNVLKALNLGQRVWLEQGRLGPTVVNKAQPLMARVVKFPVTTAQENNVATGHMKSAVKLSNTGVLTGTTRTWTNNEIQGFTGGVKVELQDRDGNVLKWDMPVQTYGVNAKALTASAPSSRTADWRFDVPVEIVNQTARIRIMHRHTPQGRLDEFVEAAWEVGKLAEFYVGLAKDVGAVASGGPATGGPTQGGTGPTEPAPLTKR